MQDHANTTRTPNVPTTLFPRGAAGLAPGAVHVPGWLDLPAQRELAAACRCWADRAGGLRAPRMPNGTSMSVEITCLGWHWFPYGYSRTVDDDDGRPVAPFPGWIGDLAREAVEEAQRVDPLVTGDEPGAPARATPDEPVADDFDPDIALVNWYAPRAKMGMHADTDEPSDAPVVSFSVGDSCVFRFGTTESRGRPWVDTTLASGDVIVFGGPSRRAYHGVPKLLPGTADPACGVQGGRFNVTIRESGLGALGVAPPDRTRRNGARSTRRRSARRGTRSGGPRTGGGPRAS